MHKHILIFWTKQKTTLPFIEVTSNTNARVHLIEDISIALERKLTIHMWKVIYKSFSEDNHSMTVPLSIYADVEKIWMTRSIKKFNTREASTEKYAKGAKTN